MMEQYQHSEVTILDSSKSVLEPVDNSMAGLSARVHSLEVTNERLNRQIRELQSLVEQLAHRR